MKKKVKVRLDRIEEQLQQLVKDVQELKRPMNGTEKIKAKAAAAQPKRTKKPSTEKMVKAKKAVGDRKVAAAKKKRAVSAMDVGNNPSQNQTPS